MDCHLNAVNVAALRHIYLMLQAAKVRCCHKDVLPIFHAFCNYSAKLTKDPGLWMDSSLLAIHKRTSRLTNMTRGFPSRTLVFVATVFLFLATTGCQCCRDMKLPGSQLFGQKPVSMESRLAKQSNLLNDLANQPTYSATDVLQEEKTETFARFQSPDSEMPYYPELKTKAAPNQKVDRANLVADVIINGNQFIPTHHLMRNISTRAGRYFDPDQLQQDVDQLWRLPEIRKINGPYIQRTNNGVVITIEVVERNHITKVDFVGNRGITDRALQKATGLQDGSPLDVHEIRMAKNKIEDLYREKGFPKTQVEITEGDEEGDQNVVFLIHEDQKQRVWKVEFEGNEFATDARLRNFVKSKPGILKLFGGLAKRDEIEQDIKRLDVYYKKFGFFNVRIGREVSESNDGRWLTLRFIIDEGPRYKVRNVSFSGASAFAEADLSRMLELKPDEEGMPDFNAAKMNQDVVALRDVYGSQGFVHANVDAEPRFLEEPGLMDIVYKVSEGQQYRVRNINVHINGDYGITKREVVLNRLTLRPGDLIDVRAIRDSERRLGTARIFAGGDPGSQGQAPKIVVKPPDLDEISRMAKLPSRIRSSNASGSGSRNR